MSARPRSGRSGSDRRGQVNLEWYRSGHNEHDWKSCVRQKRTEGSNPSHSAKKENRHNVPVLFFGIGILWEGFEQGGKTVRWTVFPTAGESLPLRHQRNLFCLPGQERFLCCFINQDMEPYLLDTAPSSFASYCCLHSNSCSALSVIFVSILPKKSGCL